MTPPKRVIAVVGTATEVGKTWVTARACEELRRNGVSVSARKPAQSFDADCDEPTDAHVLAAATGEAPTDICPRHRWYPVAMAPPMAADALDLPVPTLDQLLSELRWPDIGAHVGFVETVGGTRSPIASDGDSRAIAHRLRPDIVLVVADAGLGVIDSARGAVEAVAPLPTIVFLNHFSDTDDLHRRNLEWLRSEDGFDATTSIDDLVKRLTSRAAVRGSQELP